MYKKIILVLFVSSLASSSNNSANTASATQINNNVTTISNTMARPTSLYELRRASFDLSTLRSPGVVGQDERMGERVNARQSMPLDFTPLPYDVQNIVLGYLHAPGWHAIKNENHGCAIEFLFYDNDELIAQSSALPGCMGKVIFENILRCISAKDRAIALNLEIKQKLSLYTVEDVYCPMTKLLSQNYEALQQFREVTFKPRDQNKLNIVKSIKVPFEADMQPEHWEQATMRFSPCETLFAFSLKQAGGHITLWDLKTGTLLKTIANDKNLRIYSLDISKDLKIIVAGRNDISIAVYDIQTGAKTIIKAARGKDIMGKDEDGQVIYALALSPDGQYLASGSIMGHIFLWENQPDLGQQVKK